MRILVILGAIFIGLLVLALGAVGGAYYWATTQFNAEGPAAPDGADESVFLVERGQGVSTIAYRLEDRGLITHARLFSVGVRLEGQENALRAGEYAIPSGASMREIMDILIEGRSIVYWITIPEGLANVQIAPIIEANEVLVGEMPDLPAEGHLLPETYDFTRGTTRAQMVDRMQASMESLLAELWENRAEDLPLDSPQEALILASIVQKETGVHEELPLVASVFVNRLRQGIQLQSDPTIIYGLTQGAPLGRPIRLSELNGETEYNTYFIPGLPPTPIAAPGRAALEAVLNPPDTDYLFFVADGMGGHAFARTLSEHNRNVANWRRVQRERGER